jgi:O-antigen/teichoic acid export membrane protein
MAVGIVTTFSDRVVIGSTLGAAAVAIYTIPLDATRRLSIIADSVSGVLFPKFSVADATDKERLTDLAVKLLYSTATPVVAVFIVISDPLLRLWLGDDLGGQSASVAKLLAVAAWINTFSRPHYSSLHARNRPASVALSGAVQVVPYLLALFWVIENYGLYGAAALYLVRNSVDWLLLAWLDGQKLTQRPEVPCTLLALTALAIAGPTYGLDAPLSLLAYTTITGVITLVLSWFIVPADLRQNLFTWLDTRLAKLKR